MRQLLGVGKECLEPIRHTLQQPIARVPPEGVVDDAQMVDVEHHDRERRQAIGAARQQSVQPLAEQRPLGEAGQRFEIGEKVHRLLLVEILQRKRQVRGDLLEQQHLLLTDAGRRAGTAQKGPHGRVVDAQRQHRERAHAGGEQRIPPEDDVRGLRDFRAQDRLAGADHAPHETRIVLLAIGDREFGARLGHELLVAGPPQGARHPRPRVDERHHRDGIAAHVVRQAAGLADHLLAVLNPHQRRVDSRQHLQHTRQPGDALLRQLPRAPRHRLLQCALHCRHQPLGVALQHVVDGAALERLDGALFTDRAGEEDEGNVGYFAARNLERRHAVE